MTSEQIDQLERLSALKDKGVLTDAEFASQKARILEGGEKPVTPARSSPAVVPDKARPEPPRGYVWTPFRVLMALVAIPAMLLLIFTVVGGGVVLTALRGGPIPEHVTLLPSPHFKINEVNVDDSCSRLTDYCVRVTCVVTNDGTADGSLPIDFSLSAAGRPTATATETATLKKGAQGIVSHDFGEAKLADSDLKGACRAPG